QQFVQIVGRALPLFSARLETVSCFLSYEAPDISCGLCRSVEVLGSPRPCIPQTFCARIFPRRYFIYFCPSLSSSSQLATSRSSSR
ncbi:hypothetical protein CSUI_007212, partial [Cystoisospora suis]